jgi:hypothetical protein
MVDYRRRVKSALSKSKRIAKKPTVAEEGDRYNDPHFKGTVARDFRLSVFFHQSTPT